MRGICLSVHILFIYEMVELKSQRKGVKEYTIVRDQFEHQITHGVSHGVSCCL